MTTGKNKGGKFILGAALGALAGAAAGILLAPKSGKATRKAIADKAGDLLEKSKDVLEQGKEAVSEQVEKIAGGSADSQPKE